MPKSTAVTISIGDRSDTSSPQHWLGAHSAIWPSRGSGEVTHSAALRAVRRPGRRRMGLDKPLHTFISTHAAHTVGTITLARPCTVFYIRPGRDGGWYDLLDVTPVTLSVIRTRYVISTPVTISVSSHKVKKKEAKYYTETSSSVLQDLMCLSSD